MHLNQKLFTQILFLFFLLQIVGDGMGYIRDLTCCWPGSAHDSRIWETSRAKEIFEQQDDYSIVGDRNLDHKYF